MLTDEQRETIENSLWVVNAALKNQGLSGDEDLRQSAILYMCICIQRFDESQNTKWTTYAYKNVFFYIKRLHNKETAKAIRETPIDQITGIGDTNSLDDGKIIADDIKSRCTPLERRIIDLFLQGYGRKDICNLTGYGKSKISECIKSIRAKAKDYRS